MKGCVYSRGRIWWVKFYYKGKPYRWSTKSVIKNDAEQFMIKINDKLLEVDKQEQDVKLSALLGDLF